MCLVCSLNAAKECDGCMDCMADPPDTDPFNISNDEEDEELEA